MAVETSSGRLAAAALERARTQIAALGESGAWDRWQHDQIVWRLADGPDANPQSLLLAGYTLVSPRPGRLEEAAWLAGRYVVGALLLVLTRHGQPSCSTGSKGGLPAGALGLGDGNGNGNGDGNGNRASDAGDGGVEAGGDALARALAALGEACDQARSRPAVLRELRRLHHGLAQVRGAVIQGERAAVRRARRARQAGLRAGAGSSVWSGRATAG